MLVKFQTSPESDEQIERIQKRFGINTGSGAALRAVLELDATVVELGRTKSRLGAVEDELGKLKKLIRDRNELDLLIRGSAEQGGLDI